MRKHMRRPRSDHGWRRQDVTYCGLLYNIWWGVSGLSFRKLPVTNAWKNVTCKNCLRARRK